MMIAEPRAAMDDNDGNDNGNQDFIFRFRKVVSWRRQFSLMPTTPMVMWLVGCISGLIIFVGSTPVLVRHSRQQGCIATSTCCAEFISMIWSAAEEAISIRYMLHCSGIPVTRVRQTFLVTILGSFRALKFLKVSWRNTWLSHTTTFGRLSRRRLLMRTYASHPKILHTFALRRSAQTSSRIWWPTSWLERSFGVWVWEEVDPRACYCWHIQSKRRSG